MGKAAVNKRRKKSPVININKLSIFIIGLLIGSIITLVIVLFSHNNLITNQIKSSPSTLSTTKNKDTTKIKTTPVANAVKNPPLNKYDFYNLLTKDNNNSANPPATKSMVNNKKSKYLILIGEKFTNTKQADELKANLALQGFEANITEYLAGSKKKITYDVTIGPFMNIKTAVNKQQQLILAGFKNTTIKKHS
jgi:cell division protein FtsN